MFSFHSKSILTGFQASNISSSIFIYRVNLWWMHQRLNWSWAGPESRVWRLQLEPIPS